jgi:hypothetical protein
MRSLAFAALALFAVGACATSGAETTTTTTRAGRDMARLRSECDARGGILVASGRLSGEPALDYYCNIRGASTPAP